jgi:hypothetical protein
MVQVPVVCRRVVVVVLRWVSFPMEVSAGAMSLKIQYLNSQ